MTVAYLITASLLCAFDEIKSLGNEPASPKRQSQFDKNQWRWLTRNSQWGPSPQSILLLFLLLLLFIINYLPPGCQAAQSKPETIIIISYLFVCSGSSYRQHRRCLPWPHRQPIVLGRPTKTKIARNCVSSAPHSGARQLRSTFH